ncbi:MAG: hypothetical protein QNJ70_06170 [Xenococcaceae cyanobacterium MO_207.B15]|nr:hypothetical protein [Xenococcaceae cyanobacterium MO_207.B15]
MKSKSQLDWFYTLPNLLKNDSGDLNIKWQTTNRAKANIIRISQQQNTKNEAIIARIVYENLSAAVQGDVTVENWTAFLSRHSEKAAKKIQEKLIASGTLSSQELVNSFEELILISFTFASQPILFLANFKCQEVSDYIWYKILH